jgi:hypothetical protein
MAEPSGDLEARVAALEARVGELADRVQHSEQDAAAARVLAGGADRDVDQVRGEIRDFRQAATGGCNALCDDLIDLRSEMRSGFTEVRGRMDATAAGLDQIAGPLNTLIGQQGGDQPGVTDRSSGGSPSTSFPRARLDNEKALMSAHRPPSLMPAASL